MGNSHSTTQYPAKPQHSFRRQRSAVFSRISLGCASINSSTSSQDHSQEKETSNLVVHEKSANRGQLTPSLASPSVAYSPSEGISSDAATAYAAFLHEYPEYRSTWILDTLRRTDYARLERTGETYVDFMGGALYPESLIRVHTEFLARNVMGNTHSVSNSSKLSLQCADEARAAVLSFFKAPPEYTVIFTANATAALKLVGESFPFTGGSSYVLGTDSHNSVHGIREYAIYRGARVCYIQSTPNGGFDTSAAKNILLRNRPRARELAPSLFGLTAQSNISNSKNPLSTIEYAASLGYCTLLDAAALAPTSSFSLKEHSVDAMAVSFYKMFGFPTGVGALVVKKSFLAQLKRPWFAGGTVDVVQVPGTIVTRAHEPHEQFEDGTINYLTLPAITDGLQFLSAYLPFLPLRLTSLLHYLINSLSSLRHDTTGQPVVRILSRLPTRRLRSVGDQADTGSMVSLIFLSPTGDMLPNSFIEYSASQQHISLRTGCMCNPGGAAAILGIQEDMQKLYPGVTLKDFENIVGRELGVVRISLGLANNFQDVWKVVRFAALFANGKSRQTLWDRWIESSGVGVGQAI
ncbi:putative aminotransferase class-V [Lyophyllum shimeji]|uniref:Aminotransferase class-V n=1 Tax=Lyophyllum shimeji TaxID=47721 RepID=A0A9P3UKC2_LYOSH|nr:putative aminotransferase class-V [Lyophyllum shimeji]